MARSPESKLISIEEIGLLADKLRSEGKRIATTNGCFDLLHWGHLKYLSEARSLADVLICGINSDASVKKLKGPSRPLCDETSRALQIASIEAVDYVVIFDEQTPERLLKAVRPHLHTKGGDYDGKEIPEQKVMAELGGKIVFLPIVAGLSTTNLIEKIRHLP